MFRQPRKVIPFVDQLAVVMAIEIIYLVMLVITHTLASSGNTTLHFSAPQLERQRTEVSGKTLATIAALLFSQVAIQVIPRSLLLWPN